MFILILAVFIWDTEKNLADVEITNVGPFETKNACYTAASKMGVTFDFEGRGNFANSNWIANCVPTK